MTTRGEDEAARRDGSDVHRYMSGNVYASAGSDTNPTEKKTNPAALIVLRQRFPTSSVDTTIAERHERGGDGHGHQKPPARLPAKNDDAGRETSAGPPKPPQLSAQSDTTDVSAGRSHFHVPGGSAHGEAEAAGDEQHEPESPAAAAAATASTTPVQVPWRLRVREHGHEHLLRVESPSEGQQHGLEKLAGADLLPTPRMLLPAAGFRPCSCSPRRLRPPAATRAAAPPPPPVDIGEKRREDERW
uniref:Uncharacterized protein n=1 Tax=Oryza meridionalis TaxID=40149 RepID=A0A0E0C1C2_9ORYZ